MNRVNSSNLNATILKFSEKFEHPFSHVFIFGNKFSGSRGFVAMPVTSCVKDTYSNLSLSIKLVKKDEIARPCEWHSNETVTLWKHIENRGFKIARVNSIPITKSINLL